VEREAWSVEREAGVGRLHAPYPSYALPSTLSALRSPLALYLHIPFCAVRCGYCDFNTYAGLEALFEPYTAALSQEIRRAGVERGRPAVRTIFFGGGTPTVLPAELLARVLDACREAFAVALDAEITSEANPGTVDQAHFAALTAMGVNRLSMGVQSFDDVELNWLGRIHSAAEAEAAFEAARAAGFTNINLDFIFGLPDQNPATWAHTLARAIDLAPEHLSLYSLTVESGTPLFDQVTRGAIAEPDDDLAADLYSLASDALAAGGYEQYEISNWARIRSQGSGVRDQESESASQLPHAQNGQSDFQLPRPRSGQSSFQCRHNLVYWRNEPYLGFGAGAHSFAEPRRWWNVKPVPEYIRRIAAGQPAEREGERIDRRLAMGETMMLGLRLVREGVEDARFRARFGVGLDETFDAEIAVLVRRGLLMRLPDRVRLTPEGRLLGNQVFAEFLPG
jgi:oxygen-independent coproporphyrinogen III oxidase